MRGLMHAEVLYAARRVTTWACVSNVPAQIARITAEDSSVGAR